MIVYCEACSAQNFVSPERLAVREIPPRCWGCGRVLPFPVRDGEPERETCRKGPESNRGAKEE